MKKSFLKTLNGKFVSRTVMLAVAIAVVIGGLAVASLRSLNGTANASVEYARDRLPRDSVEPLEALASDISSASSRLTLLLILITLIGAIAAGALALVFARQITSPIVRLRDAAMKSATTLPDIVEASAQGDEELPELPSIVLTSGDEVEELAQSFNVVQRTAAELAVKQARMRKQNGERFVNLGRRSQNLLARQMNFIDAMEKDETNPANLKRLFQIDHLATRMRRNAESVLVLAEESSPRRLRGPVSMHQVVQAASGEIEHFDRIAVSGITDAAVEASVAHDLAHLLAELLENATSFAPPETATTVSGIAAEHGYTLEIVDHGIGMEEEAMAAANARFSDESGSLDHQHSPSYLGHDVVARLARRHAIAVELTQTPTGGLTARLHLPHATLSSRPNSHPQQPTTEHVAAPQQVPVADDPVPAAPHEAGGFSSAAAPVDYIAPPTPDDASSLQSFTPPVPDDASALVEAQPPTPDAFPSDAPSLEGFTTAVPDDVSSLINESAMAAETMPLAEPEPYPTPVVPDDASSLTDPPDGVSESSAFDIPTFEEVAPMAEIPAFDPPTFEEVAAPATEAPTFDPPTFEETAAPTTEAPTFDPPTFEETAAPTTQAATFDPPPFEEVAIPFDQVAETHFEEVASAAVLGNETPAADSAMAVEEVGFQADPAQFEEVVATSVPNTEAVTATTPAADAGHESEDWAQRGLTPGQRAAIEWAMEKGGDGASSSETRGGPIAAPSAPAAGAPAAELRPGPIDATALSDLGTTASGFVPRVRGEEGAKRFSPTAEAPRRATSAPNPEQLLKFREGIESGHAAADDGDAQ